MEEVVEFPTGSGTYLTLIQVAKEIARRCLAFSLGTLVAIARSTEEARSFRKIDTGATTIGAHDKGTSGRGLTKTEECH